jgi:hypothetical protein
LKNALERLFFVLRSGFRYFPDHFVKTPLPLLLVLVFGASAAQAASFDCVAPVFPDHSTTKEGVRRIEKQVRQWRACNAAHRSTVESAQVDKLNTEVDAGLAKWIAATRARASGGNNAMLTEIEREKVDYGTWMRGSSQSGGAPPAGPQ